MTQTTTSGFGKPSHRVMHSTENATLAQHKVRAHPLGVRPDGNALTAPNQAHDHLGALATLTDDLILILLAWLDDIDLSKLGQTCRALFAFTCNDELWKTLIIQKGKPRSGWRGSWRASYLERQSPKLPPIDCALYSDALYRPFFCSQLDLAPFVFDIPPKNNVPRLANLSEAEFSTAWVDRPFILTEPVKEWPVFNKWCQKSLLDKYENVDFRAEAVDWPLDAYIEYMNNNDDETPLYLFDRDFVRKMNLSTEEGTGAYWPPRCFGEDLFALLGEQRPDSRWLIMGAERSGSTFHKDPNATSAWNAVIQGSKYWIMFPGSILPPGVIVSEDQSEVTSPLSIAEWLLNFHEEARRMTHCREGICREGEVVHVPSGWWHLVVNLAPAIAITQNFVPLAHLSSALEFLEKKPDQVSGFSNDVQNPYQLFLGRLIANGVDPSDHQRDTNGRKRKWKNFLTGSSVNDAVLKEAFQFGFTDDIEEEAP